MNKHTPTKTPASLLTLLLILGVAAGCHKKTVEITPDLSSSDEALYRLGEAEMKRDTEKAILYLRQIMDSFPKSFYAQRAKLLIADAYFRKGDESNLLMAAAEYREFIRMYPYSPSAAYSQYQVAMTFYKKILKPGRDQSKTTQALAEFKKVITDFPASDQAKTAQEKIKDCEERLAAHSAEIAIGYNKRRAYRASISRLTEIMTSYPDYSHLEDIYYYLGDCHFMLRQYDQAVPFFTKVITDYPGISLAKEATKRLVEIEKAKAILKDSKVVKDKKL
ncbi:MAG: outer membrane protein assembly factor BamD [Candidatus Aminicenantes bacterium]|nr:outer membrane protein assembly factor BamD [Candidatus Aminicenantes bacterium]TFG57995.1 MAG: outer membrane protein assembly factor BamD [Candidatus Aminicenantes bacterium]